MIDDTPAPNDDLAALNGFFIDALRTLGADGLGEEACRLAASAWSVLRHRHPQDAERLNRVLHVLTRKRP